MANKIALGKVAFTDRGKYSASETYVRFDFVNTDDSCYLSLQDGNKGHAVTDEAWWKCLARGTTATEAAGKANGAAAQAQNAALNANDAAQDASQAATLAENAAGTAEDSATQADAAKERAENAANEALAKIADMDALGQTISSFIYAAPVRMEVEAPATISTKNAVQQRIRTKLSPAYVMGNVLFQRSEGTSLAVNPSGYLRQTGEAGTTKFYVIPAQNTELWQEISITVRQPLIRLTGNGKMRLANGKIRIV